jgi:hypothetical protein
MEFDRFDDIAFGMPAGWARRTAVVFTAPAIAHGADAPSVCFMREPFADNETLETWAERQMLELRHFPHLRLIAQRVISLGGAPALQKAYEWQSARGGVAQISTFFESRRPDGARVVTHVTMTCAKTDLDRMGPVFDAWVEQMRAAPLEEPRRQPSDFPSAIRPAAPRVASPIAAPRAASPVVAPRAASPMAPPRAASPMAGSPLSPPPPMATPLSKGASLPARPTEPLDLPFVPMPGVRERR